MDGRLYQCGDSAFLRAAAMTELPVPLCPDLSGDTPELVARWLVWLRNVWTIDAVADAIDHASPGLAREVQKVLTTEAPDVRRVRRTVLSVARYVLRMTNRATPFGMFAGVARASFGQRLIWRWDDHHRVVARVDEAWLADVIARLESCRELFSRLTVVVNEVGFRRGDRLVVPYPPQSPDRECAAAAEVSVRCTRAVELVIEAARSPIRCVELAAKLTAEFPSASLPLIEEMLAGLVKQHVLISKLQPAATVVDAIGHVIEQLEAAAAGDIPQVKEDLAGLRQVRSGLAQHNSTTEPGARRSTRADVVSRMRDLNAESDPRTALTLHLDTRLVLPRRIAREAEAAASALAQLTGHPFGTTAWQRYHTRFFERYGVGTLVPVQELVNPDVGLGFPEGYLGVPAPPRPRVSERDERLLALAQAAVLDGRDEVVLDERLLEQLAPGETPQWPPHLEMCFQLRAVSVAAANDGDFCLAVTGVSRGAATMTGRFLGSLSHADQAPMRGSFGDLPTQDPDALPVQLSFAPLNHTAGNVSRVPELLPYVVGLGEHPAGDSTRIPLADLAVVCDGKRLYLASRSLKRTVEPVVPHALDLRAHTPPIVRFLAEVSSAQTAVVTGFDWGAADRLPFLPRIRYRRTIVSPARWILDAAELPAEGVPWPQWRAAFHTWSTRRQLPQAVLLVQGDRRLNLDLADPGQLALLRASLRGARAVLLEEAAESGANGWCGGRAHEIVVQLTAARAAAERQSIGVQVAGRGDGHAPGASAWLFAKLYGSPDRQSELLARYVPALLAEWDERPGWWFIRYRDPEPHIRLRIALADASEFGAAAARVGTWAQQLRRLGLLHDVQFATYYPETGRWGSGPLLAAAEVVFGADSLAVTTQLTDPPGELHLQTLTATQFLSMAIAFTGSLELGVSWVVQHAEVKAPTPLPRSLRNQAVLVADPTDDWAALCALPGGQSIARAWRSRDLALAAYRARLAKASDVDADAVLTSLLHAHHMRAVGLDPDDERICLQLARAAAQAWTARRTRNYG
ncbi:lantibiotic dehydratase [Actinomadura sp. 7K534]|uniref:lantibiotic dehydratase n=1 Tax=Actinomadura sp. 7K534 TaxID=2530366 RepID=UPI001044C367|nr:lantibiotic dehydratase [Actinomadura sp. 7K534]TDB96902.1 Lanthionine biosynthesis protein LanB [Actinomadura sp. 7K534]